MIIRRGNEIFLKKKTKNWQHNALAVRVKMKELNILLMVINNIERRTHYMGECACLSVCMCD
jgi:hypothetical protein